MLQINGVAVRRLGCLAGMIGMLSMGTSWAAVPKEPASSLDQKEFFRPELYISNANRGDVVIMLKEQLKRFEGQPDLTGHA